VILFAIYGLFISPTFSKLANRHDLDKQYQLADLVKQLEFKNSTMPFEISVLDYDDEIFYVAPVVHNVKKDDLKQNEDKKSNPKAEI